MQQQAYIWSAKFSSIHSIIILIVCLPLIALAQGNQGPATGVANSSRDQPLSENLPVQEQPNIEQQKLKIEQEKLNEQRAATKLTLLTIIVTAFGALGTIAYNIRNANYQARMQAKLKAIEVVISAAGPNTARERLSVVRQLLGDDLIDPKITEDLVAKGVGQGHDQNRKDLIKMLLEYKDQRTDVLKLWKAAFGKTKLFESIEDMEKVLGLPSNASTAKLNESLKDQKN